MQFVLIILLFSISHAWAGKNVALVNLIRGDAQVLTMGKTVSLKKNDWIENGSIIKTASRSFVKLVFIDKSQMNIGPNSEMKVEQFTGKDSGVIDLVKGKIRSQVTKDYLQINKDKSKMFIKTPNAVMGIRGTDFMISTNGKNTAAILFEGEVAFSKLNKPGRYTTDGLERIVDRGMRMFPGEFSVVDRERPQPTVPALLNIQQRNALEKNNSMDMDRSPSSNVKAPKSVVPAGLDGKIAANNSQILKAEVAKIGSPKETRNPLSREPDGYIKGNLVKPANGSFVHVDSGIIIPPGPGSVLDDNSNTYIPGQEMGAVTADGSYVPPENVEITGDGKVLVTVTNDFTGQTSTQEIEAPSPVQTSGIGLAGTSEYLADNSSLLNSGTPVESDVFLGNANTIQEYRDQQSTGTFTTGGSSSGGGIGPGTGVNLPANGLNIQINRN